mmetsp:Transcript_22218/g.52889  ORF Transcript_22218/g.52889 Transcript_22218/m.52889 type:complete len:111 (+) Transcript_22218:52-384(+)
MGGKVSGVQACAASTCCMPDQAGSVIVKTPSKSTRPGFLKASDEAVSTPVEVLDETDSPETAHPVAINTFDKLTHIHAQIHKQLEKQEMLVAHLLQDGEGLNEAFKKRKH